MASAPAGVHVSIGKIRSIRDLSLPESWLEQRIAENPSILGLGDDLRVIDVQRRQEKAGRLDLLLQDEDGERRYEVELMLGNTDESHVIRTVEYWDIERRHYPGYDHRAVLIAEDITSRFLNVISLFSGSIPITAIQVNAIEVEGHIGLTFIRVLESGKMRRDDRPEIQPPKADRPHWVARVGAPILEMVDRSLSLINEVAKTQRHLNYNKQFIGLTDGVRPNNFVHFSPKKSFLRIHVNLNSPETWSKRADESGLEVKLSDDGLSVTLTTKDFDENKGLIGEILQQAVKDDEAV